MKKVLTIVGVLLVLGLIGGGAVQYFRSTNDGASLSKGQSNGNSDSSNSSAANEAAAPAQPDWCPAVEFIAAPGTWESAANDDPLNPTANPNSFMLTITNPLKQAYPANQVKVWTLPYTAQFKNINAQNEMSYDESRDEGTSRMVGELTYMHEQCPNTKFILSGFSQGAVIVGDVASRIGTGSGPVPAESILGVAAIADGRRQNGVGINPGNPVSGVGAEIALQPLNLLVQGVVPGATMRGAREGGFGSLSDRTYEICAPDDTICDAPADVTNGLDRAMGLISANGVHALYATNPNVIPGSTANQWVVGWARQLIDAA